jgi:hypothetical protein
MDIDEYGPWTDATSGAWLDSNRQKKAAGSQRHFINYD